MIFIYYGGLTARSNVLKDIIISLFQSFEHVWILLNKVSFDTNSFNVFDTPFIIMGNMSLEIKYKIFQIFYPGGIIERIFQFFNE